ncbi:MAG TPA: FHA domain-containing protein [Pyrinomonadaceae bacterium]|nr:FHA domain-containing protein [Pyrinomonadaceae bacterium]
MITCERCHTENIEGSQYCDECGAVLPAAAPRKGAIAAAETAGPEDDEATPAAAPTHEPVPERRRSEAAGLASGRQSQVVTPMHTSLAGQPQALGHARSEPPQRASETKAHAKLVIHRGRSVGKEFPLNEDEAHIGRWDADGGIFPDVDLDSDDPEAKVSRRHARITRRGGQYYIEDLGSTNGTFVNRGRRLLPGDRQPLRDGDEVIVGKTFLRFHVLGG